MQQLLKRDHYSMLENNVLHYNFKIHCDTNQMQALYIQGAVFNQKTLQ